MTLTHLHALGPVGRLVVPLIRSEAVAPHGGEGVDDMCAERRVNVLWVELQATKAVLGPVGVVAHTQVLCNPARVMVRLNSTIM